MSFITRTSFAAFTSFALACATSCGKPTQAAGHVAPDLVAPLCRAAAPDEPVPAVRPVFEVRQSGAIYCDGQLGYDPARDGASPEPIRSMLRAVRQGRADQLTFADEKFGNRNIRLVQDPFLIRADRFTEWHYIGLLMMQCSQPEIAFWKLEFAMVTERDGALVDGRFAAHLPKDNGIDIVVPVEAPEQGDIEIIADDPGAGPEEQLSIGIHCRAWGTEMPRNDAAGNTTGDARPAFDLEGHVVTWTAGPVKVTEIVALGTELRRMLPMLDTEARPPVVVIEPRPGVTYGDVAATIDAIVAAAADAAMARRPRIYFGGGLGARQR
ncbi:MAG: hypothetical protein KDC98_07130 [Planctomycetes bacterium]|nr:hypothetical protein [Planctomycetota bacterium]